ncbi:M20/M25/M40 family metallo-hydrolase [Streptomyces sp. MP131-18]|uniref:M20/M25/M40 family metallo-hydrolase n=1 Tax=Streptomyces sp. MP131-18 TaxID=1857892 RepID=UPI00209AD43B|nr:M20/M25/M40 family metallo-hydrolase [Streptomyces sp. MP131-18]
MTFPVTVFSTLVPITLLATAGLAPAGPAPADTPAPRALVAAATGEGAFRHLTAFQDIAERHGGNRAAGTPGHERSARYAGALLAEAGYRVTYQRFAFPYREPVTERLTRLGGEPRDIPVRALSFTGNTPDGGLTTTLADAGDGCAPDDFDPAALHGRIALIERGGCTFAEKQAGAAAAGAAAVLIRNNVPGPLTGTLGGPDPAALPTGGLGREDGAALAGALADALAAGQEVTLHLELTELAEERTTVNVIAESRGGDQDRVVMAGAHLDSVLEGPGINDNGSGSAGVLETALRLAETSGGRHPNRVRFALWSAEESGLLGSEHYVEHLPPAEREDIAVYLNFDMIGSPNHGQFVYEGNPAVTEDITAFLRGRGQRTAPTPFNGRSDYAPFVAAGIPSGGTFTGAEGIKSEAEAGYWGGTAGAAYDPCYHAACDTLDNIGRAALDTHVKVIAHTVGTYAWRAPH